MAEERPRQVAANPAADPRLSELRTRVLSGAALGAVSLIAVYAGHAVFAAFMLAVAFLVSWEWSRIVRGSASGPAFYIQSAAIAAACLATLLGNPALAIAFIAGGAVAAAMASLSNLPALSAAGVAYAGLPTVALVWLRGDTPPNGFLAVLFVILAVAVTDTAAFAAGRSIGGPRLAPFISPNKTWSGLIGGISGSALTGAVFAMAIGAPTGYLAAVAALLGLVSQAGDLTESAIKRSFGLKDTGALIPGHGGAMDRVDGIVFAAVFAALLAIAHNPVAPGTALLYGH